MKIKVTTRGGDTVEVSANEGWSIMEALRSGGVDDILAMCGGCCSCATCHVYVDPNFSAMLPPMSEAEDELLDTSMWRRPESRLSCQIPVSAQLDGAQIVVAPED